MTDIEKRAEELYPEKWYYGKDYQENDSNYNSRQAFIKGYSEGYEKGKEGMVVAFKQSFVTYENRIETLQQRVKELEEEKETSGALASYGFMLETQATQLLCEQLKAENEQLRKDVTEFAEWVEDRTLYFWQINTLTTADEYLKMFKEEKSVE
jgi:hypothetical protein